MYNYSHSRNDCSILHFYQYFYHVEDLDKVQVLYLYSMADAINPGSVVLERAGVSSSWTMVDHKSLNCDGSTYTVNEYDIACILSWDSAALNLPGLFLPGSGFSVTYSTNGGSSSVITTSSSTSVKVGAFGSRTIISIIFYKFPSE